MAESGSNRPERPRGSYGKRPLWQWILIYIVIAIIVYGLIYLIFFSNNGGSGYYR